MGGSFVAKEIIRPGHWGVLLARMKRKESSLAVIKKEG